MRTMSTIMKGIYGLLLLVSCVVSAQGNDHKKELDAIFTAFQTKDYSLVDSILDENVKIHPNIPVGMNLYVIPQVLEQLPEPASYEVLKKETIGGNTRYTTEYRYDEGTPRLQYFTFNAEGKAIELDILQDAQKVESSTQLVGN